MTGSGPSPDTASHDGDMDRLAEMITPAEGLPELPGKNRPLISSRQAIRRQCRQHAPGGT